MPQNESVQISSEKITTPVAPENMMTGLYLQIVKDIYDNDNSDEHHAGEEEFADFSSSLLQPWIQLALVAIFGQGCIKHMSIRNKLPQHIGDEENDDQLRQKWVGSNWINILCEIFVG